MTPKEKAKEILERMYKSTPTIQKEEAAECALIAVDEIINQWDHFTFRDIERKDYWQLVRLAILEDNI